MCVSVCLWVSISPENKRNFHLLGPLTKVAALAKAGSARARGLTRHPDSGPPGCWLTSLPS